MSRPRAAARSAFLRLLRLREARQKPTRSHPLATRRWHGYLQSLPAREPLPITWSEEDAALLKVCFLLDPPAAANTESTPSRQRPCSCPLPRSPRPPPGRQGTELPENIARDRERMRHDWETYIRRALPPGPSAARPPLPAPLTPPPAPAQAPDRVRPLPLPAGRLHPRRIRRRPHPHRLPLLLCGRLPRRAVAPKNRPGNPLPLTRAAPSLPLTRPAQHQRTLPATPPRPGRAGHGMVPLADLFNHVAEEHVHFTARAFPAEAILAPPLRPRCAPAPATAAPPPLSVPRCPSFAWAEALASTGPGRPAVCRRGRVPALREASPGRKRGRGWGRGGERGRGRRRRGGRSGRRRRPGGGGARRDPPPADRGARGAASPPRRLPPSRPPARARAHDRPPSRPPSHPAGRARAWSAAATPPRRCPRRTAPPSP